MARNIRDRGGGNRTSPLGGGGHYAAAAKRDWSHYSKGGVGSGLFDFKDTFYQNDKIDPRLARGNPHRGKLHRGRMVRKGVDTDEVKGILNFLFNPTSVSFGYNIDESALITALMDEPNQTARLGPSANCSFQLMFDRTYEVLDAEESGRMNTGVLQDVKALEHLLGINSNAEGTISAPMSQVVDIYFGADEALKFGGFFSSASVSMTHFSPRMVPFRLVMDITVVMTKEVDDLIAEAERLRGAAGDPWSGNFGSSGGGGGGSTGTTGFTGDAYGHIAALPSAKAGAAGDPWSGQHGTTTPKAPIRFATSGGGGRGGYLL